MRKIKYIFIFLLWGLLIFSIYHALLLKEEVSLKGRGSDEFVKAEQSFHLKLMNENYCLKTIKGNELYGNFFKKEKSLIPLNFKMGDENQLKGSYLAHLTLDFKGQTIVVPITVTYENNRPIACSANLEKESQKRKGAYLQGGRIVDNIVMFPLFIQGSHQLDYFRFESGKRQKKIKFIPISKILL